jgi:rhomboid protease GluP
MNEFAFDAPMNKQQLRWKVNRWIRQVESQFASFRNLWQGTQVKTRMCPSCRALVGVAEKTCSFCGVRLGYRPSGLGKLLQNFLPNYAPVSYLLLTVNFLLFLLIFVVERDLSSQDLRRLLLGVEGRALVRWGADVALLVNYGEWWRLFSAMFIHIGIIHLLFNSYALIYIGPILEDLLGRQKFLVIYLATGVFGFLLSNWYYDPRMPTAGASGAIFGMIGAAIMLSRRWAAGSGLMREQLIHWAIYGFAYGLFIGANNAAHFGGFVSGLALAYVLPNPNHVENSGLSATFWKVLFWIFLGLCIASLLLALRYRLAS